MLSDLESLKIERVIFHRVYKRENMDQIVEPSYSDCCTFFDQSEKRTLKTRITNRAVKLFK